MPQTRERSSHVGIEGRARRVDVGARTATAREAVAAGRVTTSALARRLVREVEEETRSRS
jgi:molybdenum cofactor biosynthesis enzyme